MLNYIFRSIVGELIRKKFDLEMFGDSLFTERYSDTFSNSEFITCSKAQKFLLASKRLVSSANSRS